MSKIFRVFFSSTFSDLVEERNAIQKEVFPKLKELCAVHGTRFQPIDLRWGIPDEIALQQSTMQICLEEIKRCQNLTPRPNFLVLLGERYGWTPPPAKIPKTEYDVISAHFSEEEKTLIKEWYRHDENELCKLDDGTITTVYELQPRGENYENYKKWETIEIKLRDILLQAARKADLSKKEMVKYYASATHQEIVLGALEAQETGTHVHCFFRKLNGLPERANSGDYLESEPEKKECLSNLKKELEQQLPLNIHKYEVNLGDEKDKEKYLEKFWNDVYNSLETTILKEIEDMEELSALEEEINAHIIFGKDRTNVFVGREDILNDIVDYVENDNRTPFLIFGESGSGKSALMAKAFEKLKKESIDVNYILRFIGTTFTSSDSIALIRSICEQIINEFEINFEGEIPFDYNEIKETFSKLLSLIQEGERTVILLDALDQLPRKDKGRDLTWLPQELPENVKLITSFATDDNDIMNTLEKKLPSSLNELKRLSLEDGDKTLNILLENARRRLTHGQRDLVLQKFSRNGLPLYLKLAFEESCTWNSYEDFENIKLAQNIEGLTQILFERLYKEHTQKIVERILCYIVAARNGLTEDEILDVMSSDPDFFKWYKEEQIHHELPEERLPWIVWSRLRSSLEPYLTIRGVDHTSTISFFHRQFNKAVIDQFLSRVAEERYRVLAEYFENTANYYQLNGTKIPNYRKLSELVYNLIRAQKWDEIELNLTDLAFIEAKCTARMTEDLINDFNTILEKVGIEWKSYFRVKNYLDFIIKQANLLRAYPELTFQLATNQPDESEVYIGAISMWKARKETRPWLRWINKPQSRDLCIMTLELHGKISALAQEDCKFSPDGSLIASLERIGHLIIWDAKTGNLIAKLYGDHHRNSSCDFSPDGLNMISFNDIGDLEVWNLETYSKKVTLKGHDGRVESCTYSHSGKKFASAGRDGFLKIWDLRGEQASIKIKDYNLYSCSYSPDDTLILVSHDDGISVVSADTLEVIKEFSKGFLTTDAKFFNSGRKIVSAAVWDKTLKIFDAESFEEIATLSGHTDEVFKVAVSNKDLLIASVSRDRTVKLWNAETGDLIITLKGHNNRVTSCHFSPDDKYLISSSDSIKLWDISNNAIEKWKASQNRNDRSFEESGEDLLIFSPDGSKFISGFFSGDNKLLKIWDSSSFALISVLKGHNYSANNFTFSPDGSKLISAASGGKVILWDIKSGKKIKEFILPKGLGAIFSPDGSKLISAASGGKVILWDIKSGKKIKEFIHPEGLNTCTLSPDGSLIATGSDDGIIRLWDGISNENGSDDVILTFSNPGSDLEFSPDGTKLISYSNCVVFLWDLLNKEHKFFGGHCKDYYVDCSFSPDGSKIIASSSDGVLVIIDAINGKYIASIDMRIKWILFRGHKAIVFSPDALKVLCADPDGPLIISDIEKGEELARCVGHKYECNVSDFSPDGSFIISGSSDNTLRLWDLNGKELLKFIGPYDFRRIAMKNGGRTILAWDRRKLYHFELNGINLGPPILIPIRLYNNVENKFEDYYSFNCSYCRKEIKVFNKIQADNNSEINCPHCNKRLKLK